MGVIEREEKGVGVNETVAVCALLVPLSRTTVVDTVRVDGVPELMDNPVDGCAFSFETHCASETYYGVSKSLCITHTHTHTHTSSFIVR